MAIYVLVLYTFLVSILSISNKDLSTISRGVISCNSSISSNHSLHPIKYPYHDIWTLNFKRYQNEIPATNRQQCNVFVNLSFPDNSTKYDETVHIINSNGTIMDGLNGTYNINSTYYIELKSPNKYKFNVLCYTKCDGEKRQLQTDDASTSFSDSDSSDRMIITTTEIPTNHPSSNPTNNPSGNPTNNPSSNPTNNPSGNPTNYPSGNPTGNPTPLTDCGKCLRYNCEGVGDSCTIGDECSDASTYIIQTDIAKDTAADDQIFRFGGDSHCYDNYCCFTIGYQIEDEDTVNDQYFAIVNVNDFISEIVDIVASTTDPDDFIILFIQGFGIPIGKVGSDSAVIWSTEPLNDCQECISDEFSNGPCDPSQDSACASGDIIQFEGLVSYSSTEFGDFYLSANVHCYGDDCCVENQMGSNIAEFGQMTLNVVLCGKNGDEIINEIVELFDINIIVP